MNRLLEKREEEYPATQNRLYYRIGEVSRITGIKPHVLRYWESEFKAIKPHKGGSLQRLYRKKDLDLIFKIKQLLYEEGFTISGAKKKIREFERAANDRVRLRLVEKRSGSRERELLMAIREELKSIRQLLE